MKKEKEKLFLEEYDNLRLLYKQIIDGCSYSKKYDAYIKHFTELDLIECIEEKQILFSQAKSLGIESEEEKLLILFEKGAWKKGYDEEIISLQYNISDNEKMLVNMVSEVQKQGIKSMVSQAKWKLNELRDEKDKVLGLTAEKYSDEKSLKLAAFRSFFKDAGLTAPMFADSFDELYDDDVDDIIREHNSTLNNFNERNMRKIAACPFVLNLLSFVGDNPALFLDKPMTKYTIYQQNILSYGKRNTMLLNQAKGEPPDITAETKTQELLVWYDSEYSMMITKRMSGGSEPGVTTTTRMV